MFLSIAPMMLLQSYIIIFKIPNLVIDVLPGFGRFGKNNASFTKFLLRVFRTSLKTVGELC